MPAAEQPESNEQALTRYLLGALSEEETQRFDERSITDEEFAMRLDIAEHELVDSFVSGELAGESLERFKRYYLASPKRAEKVEFARALRRLNEQTASRAARQTAATAESRVERASVDRYLWRWLRVPRIELQWAFAGGVLAILFAAGYLFLENTRLRKEVVGARAVRATVDAHESELQRQLQDQRSANAELAKQLEGFQKAQTSLDEIKTVVALLMPPTRGAERMATVSLARDTMLVVLLVRLEADEFPLYGVELKDAVANQPVWQRRNLKAESSGTDKNISLSVPARLLKQQTYVLQVTGVRKQGHTETLSSYAFQVVIK